MNGYNIFGEWTETATLNYEISTMYETKSNYMMMVIMFPMVWMGSPTTGFKRGYERSVVVKCREL